MFKPAHGFCLLEAIEQRETEGGIALPDSVTEGAAVRKMRVIAMGEGQMLESGTLAPVPARRGDVVFVAFPSYAESDQVEINGQKYIIARQRYIAGVLE